MAPEPRRPLSRGAGTPTRSDTSLSRKRDVKRAQTVVIPRKHLTGKSFELAEPDEEDLKKTVKVLTRENAGLIKDRHELREELDRMVRREQFLIVGVDLSKVDILEDLDAVSHQYERANEDIALLKQELMAARQANKHKFTCKACPEVRRTVTELEAKVQELIEALEGYGWQPRGSVADLEKTASGLPGIGMDASSAGLLLGLGVPSHKVTAKETPATQARRMKREFVGVAEKYEKTVEELELMLVQDTQAPVAADFNGKQLSLVQLDKDLSNLHANILAFLYKAKYSRHMKWPSI